MKVYLLRHGETEGNVNGQFSGFTDTPLTLKGIEQAKEAHLKLEGESFDVVISSPLSRAVDTAFYTVGGQVILDDGFKEMNFGIFEGLTYLEIQNKYPEAFINWRRHTESYNFETGESLNVFFDRVVDTYQKVLKSYTGKKVLIVAHSGVIRTILASEISETLDHYWKYKVDNCSISIIEYVEGYTVLEKLNW